MPGDQQRHSCVGETLPPLLWNDVMQRAPAHLIDPKYEFARQQYDGGGFDATLASARRWRRFLRFQAEEDDEPSCATTSSSYSSRGSRSTGRHSVRDGGSNSTRHYSRSYRDRARPTTSRRACRSLGYRGHRGRAADAAATATTTSSLSLRDTHETGDARVC